MAIFQTKPWGNVKPTVGYVVDWSDPINRGLVSRWLFNETAGTVFDITKKNNGQRINGVSNTAGLFGTTLNFTWISSQYVKVPYSTSLDLSTEFTICGWINASSSQSYPFIIARDNSTAGQRCYGIFLDSGGAPSPLSMQIFRTDGDPTVLDSTTLISINKWYFFAATYQYVSNGTSIIKMYINGALDASTSSAVGPIQTASNDLWIGARQYASFEEYWDGKLDNFGVFNRVLTAQEVARLYTEPFAGIQQRRIYIPVSSGAAPAVQYYNRRTLGPRVGSRSYY